MKNCAVVASILLMISIVCVPIVLMSCSNEIPVYTVRFDSQGGNAIVEMNVLKGSKIAEPKSPIRDNYEFEGWYKDSDLTSAWDFISDMVTSDITLYAKWKATAYLVTYNGNDNDNGSVPLAQEKTHGIDLELAANSGDLQRTGYSFTGWNTEVDGSGIDHAEGGTYTTDDALTLYAKWTANSYSVTYDANGATGGTVPDVQSKNHGINLVLARNNNGLAKEGYSFSGWNTQADGFGIDHAPEEEYYTDAALTLYAKWIAEEYTVVLDKQGGEGGSDSIIATYDSPMIFAVAPTKDGFFFEGYYDQIDGGIQYYSSTMESVKVWDKSENSILYARWIPGYIVSFNSQGGNPVSSLEGLRPDSRINEPTAPKRNDYLFDGWFKDSSFFDAWDFDSDTVTSDIMLYAKWVVAYTVSFDSQGGSSIAPLEGIRQGSKITEPTTPTRTGYDFDGWYKDNECTIIWSFESDTVEANWTFYAKWEVALYLVNFDSLGGTDVEPIENILLGTKISEPVSPVKSKHVFGGWYRDSSYAQRYYFTTDIVTSSMTLYAKWIPPSTVTFDSQGGTELLPLAEVIYGDTIIEPPNPIRYGGYTFGGWYKDSAYKNKYNFVTDVVVDSITLFARWFPDSTITFDSQGGSAVPSITSVSHGNKISAPIPPEKGGFSFDGWYRERICRNLWNFSQDEVTSNMVLYAKWVPLFLVSFDSRGGSEVQAIEIKSGTKITEPNAPIRTAHTFGGWYKDSSYTLKYNFSTDLVISSITLYAKWLPQYSVTFESQNGSEPDPKSITVAYSLVYGTLPIVTRSGYTFEGWWTEERGMGNQVLANTIVSLTSNQTLYAKWNAKSFTVSFDSQGGSSPNPSSKTVMYDQTYGELPIIMRSGYTFAGWWTDWGSSGTQVLDENVVTLTSNQKLYARWIGMFKVGDIGPSGGYIYYDKRYNDSSWRYLEAAPSGWSGNAEDPFKVWGGFGTEVGGTGTAMRTGASNTEKIVAKFGNAEPYEEKNDYAAKVCADLVITKDGMVYDDWFLPSSTELRRMWQDLYRKGLGGVSGDKYWSSSEAGAGYAGYVNLSDGVEGFTIRYYEIREYCELRVRPVRAF